MRYFLEPLRGFFAIVQQGHEDELYVGYVGPPQGSILEALSGCLQKYQWFQWVLCFGLFNVGRMMPNCL